MKISIRRVNPRRNGEGKAPLVGLRWILIGVLVILTGFGLVYAWSNLTIRRIEYEKARLVDEQRRLMDVRRRLKLELANLSSPARLESVARERLGLSSPRLDQVVDLP